MAHSEKTKARALALLMMGNTPRYVAEQTGVPLTTIRRWRPEARALWADVLTPADRAQIRDALAGIRAVFPGLLQQNGPKKKRGRLSSPFADD